MIPGEPIIVVDNSLDTSWHGPGYRWFSGQSWEGEGEDGVWGDWVEQIVMLVQDKPVTCQEGSKLSSTIMIGLPGITFCYIEI